MNASKELCGERREQDPVFLHGRREAALILAAWLGCLVWSVGYCYRVGYRLPEGQVETLFGIPSWAFWGVLIPWIVATLFSVVFGLAFIANDDLGRDRELEAGASEPAEPAEGGTRGP